MHLATNPNKYHNCNTESATGAVFVDCSLRDTRLQNNHAETHGSLRLEAFATAATAAAAATAGTAWQKS